MSATALRASEEGLLLYYPCDEKSGTVLHDAGPNHKDGKLNAEPNGEVRGTSIVFRKSDEWQMILTEGGIQRKGLIAGSDSMLADGERPIVLDRDKDYAIDYANGKIKALSGGRIELGQSVTLDFKFTNSGPEWVQGRIGGGLKLDGFDDFVDPGGLKVQSKAKSITLELWLYLPRNGPLSGEILITSWLSIFFSGDCPLLWHHWKPPASMDDLSALFRTQPMSREQWHHVAATHDGANAILFVDGHEALRHPESSDQGDITFFRLGGKHDSHFLGGIVDEIKIYNRAKTAEEIAKDAAP